MLSNWKQWSEVLLSNGIYNCSCQLYPFAQKHIQVAELLATKRNYLHCSSTQIRMSESPIWHHLAFNNVCSWKLKAANYGVSSFASRVRSLHRSQTIYKTVHIQDLMEEVENVHIKQAHQSYMATVDNDIRHNDQYIYKNPTLLSSSSCNCNSWKGNEYKTTINAMEKKNNYIWELMQYQQFSQSILHTVIK